MEKKFLAILTITLIVGGVIGYSLSPSITLQNRIDKLTTEKNGLETQIIDLQDELNESNDEITNLVVEKTALEAKLEDLQTEMLTLGEDSQMEQFILGLYFSPDGECEAQVIDWIGRANSSIHVLIYSFTLDSVSDALIEAYNEGVEVNVVFEKSQNSKYSEYQKLKSAGIQVRNDTNSALMHHKVMIVDETIVLTGSFNWSANGQERNNENLLVIQSIYISSVYENEFQRIWLNAL